MKLLLLLIPMLVLPAYPYKYMNIIIDHEKVTETASNFLYQFDLSDSIDVIEDEITDETNIIVCVPGDTTTKYPRYIHYIAGKRLLLYTSAPKDHITNDTLQVCFGSEFAAVNAAATFTNNAFVGYWGFDHFSGNTYYDYAGDNDGTATNVDTITSNYGVGGKFTSSGSDNIDLGNVYDISGQTNITLETVVNLTNLNGTRTIYKSGTQYLFYLAFSSTSQAIVFFMGGTTTPTTYCVLPISGVFTLGDDHLVTVVYNGAGATNADKLKIYVDGVARSLTFTGTFPAVSHSTGGLTDRMGWITTTSMQGSLDEISLSTDSKTAGGILDRYTMLFDTTFYSIGVMTSPVVPVIDRIEPTILYFKGGFIIANGKVAEWNGDTVAMSSETDSSFYLPVTPKGNNLPDTLKIWAGTSSLTKILKYDQKRTKLILGVR